MNCSGFRNQSYDVKNLKKQKISIYLFQDPRSQVTCFSESLSNETTYFTKVYDTIGPTALPRTNNSLKLNSNMNGFSENFNDETSYSINWYSDNSNITLTNNSLKLNTNTGYLYASMPAFSNENSNLILRFTIQYENLNDYSECRLSLYSDNTSCFSYDVILMHEGDQYFQAVNVFFNQSHGYYYYRNEKIRIGEPVEYKLVIYPHNTYEMWIDNDLVRQHSLDNLIDENGLRTNVSYKHTNINKISIFFLNNNQNKFDTIIDDIHVLVSTEN